eukprot:gnl/Ergobibamus_cyprinoides/73.p1 GENE.gnl/Ergobibamus_cyprinoides/73~~gnl/Ergobibamus_cyprinoides/73.p1  ORF type:complete len:272 (+),score=63.29 gnl/Ergobibamus_cyprinoides/73:110-817(+)
MDDDLPLSELLKARGPPKAVPVTTEESRQLSSLDQKKRLRKAAREVREAQKKVSRDKDAPIEESASKPVPRLRHVIQIGTFKPRDPRFDPTMGGETIDQTLVRRRMGFVNDMRQTEIATIKTALGKTSDPDEREELQLQLSRIEGHLRASRDQDLEAGLRRELRKKEQEAVREGKGAYFLRDSQFRQVLAARKFAADVADGKSSKKMLEKRRLRKVQHLRKTGKAVPRNRRDAAE